MGMMEAMRTPFTPDTLAERWGCSGETVRAMIRGGRLPAFIVGRSYRISAATVEAYECGTIGSDVSMADMSSSGTKTTASAAAIVLRHERQKRRIAKPAM